MPGRMSVQSGLLVAIVFVSSIAKADERLTTAATPAATSLPTAPKVKGPGRPRLELDFWTAATIGVVGVAAGGYFGYSAYQSVIAANAAADRPTYDAAAAAAEKSSRLANVSFGAAAVGAVAAASIFWQVRSEGSAAMALSPTASGLQLSGRF